MTLRSAILPLAGGILATLAAVSARADTLIDNVDGLTLDAQGQVVRFAGLLIDDNGRVEQIFKRGDKRPQRPDYRLDGKGRVLMPGIVDSHMELMKLGFSQIKPSEKSVGARPRPEDRDLALVEAQKLLLARGVTTVTDMGTTIEDWQAFRRAGDLGTLSIRIMAYAGTVESMSLIGGPGPTPWLYEDRLRLNGLYVVLDGPLDRREAALKAPYADARPGAGASGQLRLTDIQLKNLMSRAAIDRFQLAIDANGDKAAVAALDAIDELAQTYKGERRWRIEQAQLVDPVDLPRFARNGLAVSMQPQSLMAGRTQAAARLGPVRLTSAYAWKSLSGAGARLAFGSGAAGLPPEPFSDFAVAITRQGPDDQPAGGWQPQEHLTREAALAGFTTGAAWAGFADGKLGRIAIGQRADFLLVDRDPMLASPAELRGIRVLQTWVGGRLVFEAKETGSSPAASTPAATPPPTMGPRLPVVEGR